MGRHKEDFNSLTPLTEKQDKFVKNLLSGLCARDAALEAGYGEAYANTGIYVLLKKPKIIAAIQQAAQTAYTSFAKLKLMTSVTNIESSVLEHLELNPKDYPKYKTLLKELKQASGVLQPDGPQTQIINIKEIRSIMAENLQIVENKEQETIEGTIVEEDK